MTIGVSRLASMTGMMVAIAIALPCAAAPSKSNARHSAKARTSFDMPSDSLRAAGLTPFAPPLIDSARFSFTAPGHGATATRFDSTERAFRFTPSGQTSSKKAVTVGVTSRVVTAAADTSRGVPTESFAVTPAAYNVGLSVGWRGFAVSGGYTRLDSGVTALGPNRREAVDVGLSYRGKSWKTALQVAAETGSPLMLTPLERRYSVDVGGAYAVGPRLSLNGGLRYKLAPVAPGLLDADRADQSFYLGTAFSF